MGRNLIALNHAEKQALCPKSHLWAVKRLLGAQRPRFPEYPTRKLNYCSLQPRPRRRFWKFLENSGILEKWQIDWLMCVFAFFFFGFFSFAARIVVMREWVQMGRRATGPYRQRARTKGRDLPPCPVTSFFKSPPPRPCEGGNCVRDREEKRSW